MRAEAGKEVQYDHLWRLVVICSEKKQGGVCEGQEKA
jgi:hypothetical protein